MKSKTHKHKDQIKMSVIKKLFLTTLLLFGVIVFAQTGYEKAMTDKIAQVEQHKTPDDFTVLANDFKRIGDKEKTQWLPYYYAAFSIIQKGRILMRQGKNTELDAVADEAQKYLDKSSELNKDNAENLILQKMIHGLKLMVNPKERFMSEGMLAAEALSKAEKIDAENPRITLMKAGDVYFTPEQFGGSKTKGLELFQKAVKQYETYKIKYSLNPNWGKAEAEYFITNKP